MKVETEGLTFAWARHGTSREGGLHLRDHVLVANVATLKDGTTWAPDTAGLRHAVDGAMLVGNQAGAQEAGRLGYAVDVPENPLHPVSIRHTGRSLTDVLEKVRSDRRVRP